MRSAQFKIGDRVHFKKGPGVSIVGLYEVTRVLPYEHHRGFQYRVSTVPLGGERIASEVELDRVPGS